MNGGGRRDHHDDDDNIISCPLCDFVAATPYEVTQHVDAEHPDIGAASSTPSDSLDRSIDSVSLPLEGRLSQWALETVVAAPNCTPGLMQFLAVTPRSRSGSIAGCDPFLPRLSPPLPSLKLCDDVTHFPTTEDRGWGCGYRNMQMLWSSIRRDAIFEEVLDQRQQQMQQGWASEIPSIEDLQRLLETAWSEGFDAEVSLIVRGS